jgi:hypothetical protein
MTTYAEQRVTRLMSESTAVPHPQPDLRAALTTHGVGAKHCMLTIEQQLGESAHRTFGGYENMNPALTS